MSHHPLRNCHFQPDLSLFRCRCDTVTKGTTTWHERQQVARRKRDIAQKRHRELWERLHFTYLGCTHCGGWNDKSCKRPCHSSPPSAFAVSYNQRFLLWEAAGFGRTTRFTKSSRRRAYLRLQVRGMLNLKGGLTLKGVAAISGTPQCLYESKVRYTHVVCDMLEEALDAPVNHL